MDAKDGAGRRGRIGGELRGGHLAVEGRGRLVGGCRLEGRGWFWDGRGGRAAVWCGGETAGVGVGEGEVVEFAAEGFVHYFAVGVEDFAFDVFVVGRESGLGGIVEGGRHGGCKIGGCAEDERAQGEVVEDFAAVTPDVRAAVFADAFVVESVDGCNLPRLMVSSYECDSVWVTDFEAEEEEEGFKRVKAPVDEVSHEQVVCVRYVTTNPE